MKHAKPTRQILLPWHPGVTITSARAGQILGCSKSAIYDLLQDGTLEGFKIRRSAKNSHYRIIAESVYRLADERKAVGPERITVPEAAVILGCSQTTLHSMIRSKEIRAFKIRDRKFSELRVSRADVVRLTYQWAHDAGAAIAQDYASPRSASETSGSAA